MRSALDHPVLDYLRLLEWRGTRSATRARVARATGIAFTTHDHAALMSLDTPTGLDVTEFATANSVSVARASRHSHRLEEMGLIRRARSSGDGRATTLTLTPLGRVVRDQWFATVSQDYASALSTLPPEERAALHEHLPPLQSGLSIRAPFTVDARQNTTAFDEGIDPVLRFARWAAPVIGPPSYTRGLLALTGMPGSPQLLFILRACLHAPLDTSALAERTGIGAPAVSRHLNFAAAHGLIARTRPEQDGRRTRVELTPVGLHYLKAIEGHELSAITHTLTAWPSSQIDALLRALTSFTSELSIRRE